MNYHILTDTLLNIKSCILSFKFTYSHKVTVLHRIQKVLLLVQSGNVESINILHIMHIYDALWAFLSHFNTPNYTNIHVYGKKIR